MISSHKNQPQNQSSKRKFIFKIMLYLIAAAVLLIVILCLYMTQPLIWNAKVSSPVSVDPNKLESHVRMLSESFIPRDESHPENLDRCAAYIRREFESANARVSEQPFSVNGKTYRNVIAQFGPSDGSYTSLKL